MAEYDQCVVCNDMVIEGHFVRCTHENPHAMCDDCFGNHVRHLERHLLEQGRVPCPAIGSGGDVYTDGQIIPDDQAASFFVRVADARRLEHYLGQALPDRLDPNAVEQPIDLEGLACAAEEAFNTICPQCRHLLDPQPEACVAMTCNMCGCDFCWLCFRVEPGEACHERNQRNHAHVMRVHGELFVSDETRRRWRRRTAILRLQQYLLDRNVLPLADQILNHPRIALLLGDFQPPIDPREVLLHINELHDTGDGVVQDRVGSRLSVGITTFLQLIFGISKFKAVMLQQESAKQTIQLAAEKIAQEIVSKEEALQAAKDAAAAVASNSAWKGAAVYGVHTTVWTATLGPLGPFAAIPTAVAQLWLYSPEQAAKEAQKLVDAAFRDLNDTIAKHGSVLAGSPIGVNTLKEAMSSAILRSTIGDVIVPLAYDYSRGVQQVGTRLKNAAITMFTSWAASSAALALFPTHPIGAAHGGAVVGAVLSGAIKLQVQ